MNILRGIGMDNNEQSTYKGNTTLKNKLNIVDKNELESVDRLMSRARARHGLPAGRFDKAHLQAIHNHLFQDVYEWAGELRTKDLWKDNTHFVKPERTEGTLDHVFSLLKESNHLKGINHYEFTDKAARYYSRMNEVQPFREGNGRVQRAFFSQMAREAGYKIEWDKFDLDRWKEANHEAAQGNDRIMVKLFRSATKSLEQTPERKQQQLTSAYLKLPKNQAIRLYPELNDIYKVKNAAHEMAAKQLGADHEKIPIVVNRVVAKSIHEVSQGRTLNVGNNISKFKSDGMEMGS